MLGQRDEVDQFTECLNAIAETIRPLVRIAELYAKADGSIAMLRRSLPQIVSNLVEMEVAATEPEIMQFPELLKLDDVRRILAPANDLKLTLAHPPAAFAGIADKRRRGPKPQFWYSGFLRDLVEIANFLAIPVTTSADRSANPHDTRFTWLVFVAEELLLPSGMASNSLATCARRVDRPFMPR